MEPTLIIFLVFILVVAIAIIAYNANNKSHKLPAEVQTALVAQQWAISPINPASPYYSEDAKKAHDAAIANISTTILPR